VSTIEPIALRIPRWMEANEVTWAFRHGVVQGMRARGRVIPRQGHGFVQADSRTLKLADRIRREWMRRHPEEVR
jgi:hypothetical protein